MTYEEFLRLRGQTDCREDGRPSMHLQDRPEYMQGFGEEYAKQEQLTAQQEQGYEQQRSN
jgi:hypothetical protein